MYLDYAGSPDFIVVIPAIRPEYRQSALHQAECIVEEVPESPYFCYQDSVDGYRLPGPGLLRLAHQLR